MLVGRNGQGKTNLVEAIGYLATLGSHRVSGDQALIRAGADAAIIRALLAHGDRELLVELQLNRQGANRAQLNRSPVKTRELPRYAHSVLFAPEDLAIVRGEPWVRRRLLDELLVQLTPRLAGVMADYERVLKQRNTLLKSARARGLSADRLPTLDIWDERLVALGSEIIDQRLALVADSPSPSPTHIARSSTPTIRPACGRCCPSTARRRTTTTRRSSSPARGRCLASRLVCDGDEAASNDRADTVTRFTRPPVLRPKELDRGVTLAGPHRDDLLLLLNDLPAGATRATANPGRSRCRSGSRRPSCCAASRPPATRCSSSTTCSPSSTGCAGSGLAEAIGGYEQVLITAAVLEDVPEPLDRAHRADRRRPHHRGGRRCLNR